MSDPIAMFTQHNGGQAIASDEFADRVGRGIRELIAEGYISVDLVARGKKEASVTRMVTIMLASLSKPFEPLTPDVRAERLCDRWVTSFGNLPIAETLKRDISLAIVEDREEVARFAAGNG